CGESHLLIAPARGERRMPARFGLPRACQIRKEKKSVSGRRTTLPVTEQILKNSAPIADIATLRHLYFSVYRFRRPLVAKRPGNASMDSNPEKRNPAQSFTGETPVPRA